MSASSLSIQEQTDNTLSVTDDIRGFRSIEEQETVENAAQRAVTEEELIVQDTRISRLETRDVEETIEDTSVHSDGNSDEEVALCTLYIPFYASIILLLQLTIISPVDFKDFNVFVLKL